MAPERYNFKNILKTLGPGFLFAGAAIGGSHLIQSTRAGANFGFELLWLILLTNFLKYPFFEFGQRYVAATGKNLIDGYAKIGKWAVVIFYVLNIVVALANTAGVTIVTAGLTENFLHFFWNIETNSNLMSAIILVGTLLILFLGRYALLVKILKILIITLAITTVISVIVALGAGMQAPEGFMPPEIMNKVGIGFIIALLGWMPAPIESSVWTSFWTEERTAQTQYRPKLKEHLIDFYGGFFGTAVLAVIFMSLGALVMYGTGQEFPSSGIAFSSQLVKLYSETLGGWATPIITTIAMITMISTVLTVLDAYPKSLTISQQHIFGAKRTRKMNFIWAIILSIIAFIIITNFTYRMKDLIDLATVISFLAAAFFAVINYMVVHNKNFPEEYKPGKFTNVVSWLGLTFLISFSIFYILTRIGLIF